MTSEAQEAELQPTSQCGCAVQLLPLMAVLPMQFASLPMSELKYPIKGKISIQMSAPLAPASVLGIAQVIR